MHCSKVICLGQKLSLSRNDHKGLNKRFWKPAAGEQKIGFGALSGLSNTPPGVGGWVPEFVGLRLCTTKFDGLEPYGSAPALRSTRPTK